MVILSFQAILAIWKSPNLTFKPMWILGSLFGFFGLGIHWTTANDLTIEFGFSIPIIMVFWTFGGNQIWAHTMFPIIAVAALAKVRWLRDDALISSLADKTKR